VTTRPERLLDAAIEVLGTRGSRQLTHRAVDAAAGLPAGSTSNYFRTRDALVGAVVARMVGRDQADWDALAGAPAPTDVAGFADLLGQSLRAAATADRVRTLARYALFLEAGVRPGLREPLTAGTEALVAWGARWLRELGARDPERDCRLILEYMDGALLHQIARPDPDFDPVPGLHRLLDALLSR
jgi:DNA-binding transcriptional regulator YbjK